MARPLPSPAIAAGDAPDAPPPVLATDKVNAIRSRPLRDLGVQDAYAAAIEHDTLQGL